MSLIEKKEIDLIEITSGNKIQVREAIIIEKDNVIVAKSFHRYVLSPGEDISSQPQKVKDIAEVIWK